MSEQLSRDELVEKYKKVIEPLLVYLPWLMKVSGNSVGSFYSGNGIEENSLSFPVYDSNLMRFVKEVGNTELMDRNYPYVYSGKRLRNASDELKAISEASIADMKVLNGILSKYVLGGRTKAALWSEGVRNGVFLKLFEKYKELIEFWDGKSVG